MASVKRKTKAKRKSKSRGDELVDTSENGLQLFSAQTVESALENQAEVEQPSPPAKPDNNDFEADADEEAKPQPKTRVRQQLEARSEIKALLRAITTGCQGCAAQLKAVRQRVEEGQLETEHGVSFLDVRLLLINLAITFVTLSFGCLLGQATGADELQPQPVLDRLEKAPRRIAHVFQGHW